MSCHNPNCTCCQRTHRAYLEGLNDGLHLGVKRGYEAGYADGYIDASRHLPPPIMYRKQIEESLERYRLPVIKPKALSPMRGTNCFCMTPWCICGNG
jgi:hypothetical protein